MSGIFLESWKKLVSKQTPNQAMINQANGQISLYETEMLCIKSWYEMNK